MLFFQPSAHAADDWKIYASYHNPTKAAKAGSIIYVMTNGNLFSYDTEDESVYTYDKVNTLSDFGLYDIAYSQSAKTLVLLYANGNIDLMNAQGDCWNMSELKSKSITSNMIKELKVYGTEAFIATDLGVVVIDLKKRMFEGLYTFSTSITSIIADSKSIYARKGQTVYYGDRTLNLLDATNWTTVTASTYPVSKFTDVTKALKAESDSLIAKVEKININSPVSNYAYKLSMVGDRLLVAGGNFYYPQVNYPGVAMKYEGGKWSAFDDTKAIELVGAQAYMNITDVVQDPLDAGRHFFGTQRSGIYEFKNGELISHYTYDNSPLTSILPNDKRADCFVRTTALQFDAEGNLWMCNNMADTIVHVLLNDGHWSSIYIPAIHHFETFDHTVFDNRGWAWIVSRRTTATSDVTRVASVAGIVIIDPGVLTSRQHTNRFISSIVNQDGKAYTPNLYYCVAEDPEGNLWVGTSEGLFVSRDPASLLTAKGTPVLEQVKVARQDGSGLADYLLAGVNVKCIAIDGGNRKWVGTIDNGVYLISADGQETIHHFTKDNSPLISDVVNDIAIDGTTGEVFIATDAGLCSYHGNATDPAESMSSNSLNVFPNPVRPEYSGDVHITGLMANSIVKIVSAAGKLVYEGISNGGQFTWNCSYKSGKRCGSGVYYALCTDEDGNKGACTKILVVR